MYVPLTHRASFVLGPSGDYLLTPGGGQYVLIRQSLAGDTILVTSRDYTPVATPDSIRDRLIQEAQPEGYVSQNGFSPDQVPTVYPPFERIIEATDRTVWLPRYLDAGVLALDVFSPDGLYLGAAVVPEDFGRFSIMRITGEHVYGVARDELDVPYVVRLGIRKPS